ncbi:MAG: FHA domain-containing protein [Desulfobacterales bacterium]
MPTLTLKRMEEVLGVYEFERGQVLTIGRHKDNDIVIENPGASGHHAKIDSVKALFMLTDLDSTNGSLVNRKAVTTHRLKEGDVITIAKHTLVFTNDEESFDADETESLMDKTMILDTEQHRAMLAGISTETQSAEGQEERVAILTFYAGTSREFPITKKLTKIGRGSDADIVVRGFKVGKTAATISIRPNGYFLSYVSGISKPKVNGAIVKQSVMLNEYDVIQLGSTKAKFHFKDEEPTEKGPPVTA